MEQRLLRLGDIVDDYCPRERRVTNHAIVAIVDNAIRQTRCATCESEHEYKEAKVPKKRSKDASEGSDLAGGVLVTPKTAGGNGAPGPDEVEPGPSAAENADAEDAAVNDAAETAAAEENGHGNAAPGPGNEGHEAWSGHRPLIRATLPRTESDPPPQRVIPEFTMHQRHGRAFGGRGFRHGQPAGGGGGNPFRNGSNQSGGNEPDGNRSPQPGRPGRRRRRRRSH